MKIILFLFLITTPCFQSKILSAVVNVTEKLLENDPSIAFKLFKLIHEKTFIFPHDLKEFSKIHQKSIEESLSKTTDLSLNSSTWLKFVPDFNRTYPSHFDWRKKGAVTSVKLQSPCFSDWAFSAVGAIESQYFRKTGKLQDLSVQQVLDCSKNFDNSGCGGGFIHRTFEYIESVNGIMNEASYPYERQDGLCRFKPEEVAVKIKGYVYIEKGNEKALEAAVASVGPVAVGLGIKPKRSFFFYTGDIYTDTECGNKAEDLTFAALVVGYGEEKDGRKYWLLKTSFGSQWGLDGYMKIPKDMNNYCGIVTYASFPLV